MRRTQIYFDDETYQYLKKESQATHTTISEVIRQSIREKMNRRVQKALKAADRIVGIWQDRDIAVEKHIRTLRKDRKSW